MRSLVVAAVVAGLTVVVAPSPAQAADERCATTTVVAHRGILTAHVENTLGSVDAAIAAGVPFEVDVRTSANDKMLLMHDKTIARTTTGRGVVARMTARKIRRHLTDDGQRVPFVAGVLRRVRNNPGAHVHLDLKTLNRVTQNRLAKLVADYGITGQVTVISFHRHLIADFRARAPAVPTYHIASHTQPSVDEAATYGGVAVWARLMTAEWVEEMHARQVPFTMRLEDRPEAWDAAIAAGVRSIMTDDVDAYRAYCGI